MEKEKIIAKWEQEVENGDLEITITVSELYDYVSSLKEYMGADECIEHSDLVSWIKENFWSDSDVDLDDYNEWLENNNYYEDIIHKNTEYEINDYFDGREPYDIIDAVLGNDYSTNDEFFKETIYGIESFNDWEDLIEDSFRDDAIDENIVNDDTIAEIWENENEIIEKCEELFNFEKGIGEFYDCEVEDNVYVLLDKDFNDEITDVFLIDKQYDGQEIQNDINELCRNHDDYNNDMIAEMLLEKYHADRKEFWALFY